MMSRVLLLVSTALLVLMGLVMVFSASTVEAISQGGGMFDYVRKQAVFAAVGAVLGLAASRFPFQIWRGPAFLAPWALCVLLLVAVFFFGDEALGATRWLRVGSMSVQPTEFAKIVFVMGAAKVFYEYATGISSQKRTFVQTSVLLIAPILFLFVTQSDLGSAVVIFIGVVAVLWVGEAPRFWFVILIAAACVVGVLAMSTGYRAARVAVWLNPWSDEYGTGYQIIRSFYAFSEGGLFGVGLGNSREKFLYLPEAETDYIFSIIGEEPGPCGHAFCHRIVFGAAVCRLADCRGISRWLRTHVGGRFDRHAGGAGVFEYGVRYWPVSHNGQAVTVYFVGRLVYYCFAYHGGLDIRRVARFERTDAA